MSVFAPSVPVQAFSLHFPQSTGLLLIESFPVNSTQCSGRLCSFLHQVIWNQGWVDKGEERLPVATITPCTQYFSLLTSGSGLAPGVSHHSCGLWCVGRSGSRGCCWEKPAWRCLTPFPSGTRCLRTLCFSCFVFSHCIFLSMSSPVVNQPSRH